MSGCGGRSARRQPEATEHDFFARLAEAGVLVRQRFQRHRSRSGDRVRRRAARPRRPGNGGTIWYGGGKLAADLTLPKLRRRWIAPEGDPARPGAGLPPAGSGRCCGRWRRGRPGRRGTSRGSSRSGGRRGRWCGCGSATSILVRSPGTPSLCLATPAGMGSWSGSGRAAGGVAEPAPAAPSVEHRAGTARPGGTASAPVLRGGTELIYDMPPGRPPPSRTRSPARGQ